MDCIKKLLNLVLLGLWAEIKGFGNMSFKKSPLRILGFEIPFSKFKKKKKVSVLNITRHHDMVMCTTDTLTFDFPRR